MDHSEEFLKITANAKRRVRELTVDETLKRIEDGATLVDVREDCEWNAGRAAGAVHVGRGIIERDIVGLYPEKDAELILYCGGGYRSALAADSLQLMGYTNVFSMIGGWTAWNENGAPVESEGL